MTAFVAAMGAMRGNPNVLAAAAAATICVAALVSTIRQGREIDKREERGVVALFEAVAGQLPLLTPHELYTGLDKANEVSILGESICLDNVPESIEEFGKVARSVALLGRLGVLLCGTDGLSGEFIAKQLDEHMPFGRGTWQEYADSHSPSTLEAILRYEVDGPPSRARDIARYMLLGRVD